MKNLVDIIPPLFMIVHGNVTVLLSQTITLELLSFFIHSFTQEIFTGYLLKARPGIIFSI